MPTDQSKRSVWPKVLVTVTVLLTLIVGYALAYWWERGGIVYVEYTLRQDGVYTKHERFPSELSNRFFAPARYLDRTFRPEDWRFDPRDYR